MKPLPIAAAVYPTNPPTDTSSETAIYSRSEARDLLLSFGYTGDVADRFLDGAATILETMETTSSAAKVLRAYLRKEPPREAALPQLDLKSDTRSERWKAAESRCTASHAAPEDLAVIAEEQAKWDAANRQTSIGAKLLATTEAAFRSFMSGREAPPLQPGDSLEAAWGRFRACLELAERGVYTWWAASLGSRTVSLTCACKLARDPRRDGADIVTNPRCKVHGTDPAPIVQALRDGMGWDEAAEKFGATTEESSLTLPNGRVLDLRAMTTTDIAEAHNAGLLDLGPGVASAVGDSAIAFAFDVSPMATKGVLSHEPPFVRPAVPGEASLPGFLLTGCMADEPTALSGGSTTFATEATALHCRIIDGVLFTRGVPSPEEIAANEAEHGDKSSTDAKPLTCA